MFGPRYAEIVRNMNHDVWPSWIERNAQGVTAIIFDRGTRKLWMFVIVTTDISTKLLGNRLYTHNPAGVVVGVITWFRQLTSEKVVIGHDGPIFQIDASDKLGP